MAHCPDKFTEYPNGAWYILEINFIDFWVIHIKYFREGKGNLRGDCEKIVYKSGRSLKKIWGGFKEIPEKILEKS